MLTLTPLPPARRALATALVLALPLLGACTPGRPAQTPAVDAVPTPASGDGAQAGGQEAEPEAPEDPAAPEDLDGAAPSAGTTQGGSPDGAAPAEQQVERGPHCTAADLRQPVSPDDLSPETSRELALSMVGKTVPAAPHTTVEDSFDNTSAYIVRVEAGAQTVEVNAGGTVVIVEGDIDTLIVNGLATTVWVDNVDHVRLGPQAAGSYVLWTGTKPDLQDQGLGNTVARAEYAVHVHNYC